MNSSKNIFIKNTSTYFIVNIVTAVGSILLMPVYTSYLNPEDWGIVALFMFFGPTVAGLVSLGLPRASYYFYFKIDNSTGKYNELQSTNFYTIIIIYILIGSLIFLFTSNISSLLFNDRLPRFLLSLSFLSGCLHMLTLYMGDILAAQNRAYAFSCITLTRFFFVAIVSLYLIFNHSMTYMARVNGVFFANIVCFILSIYFLKNNFIFSFSISSLKKSLSFSYPEIPISAFGVVVSSFDKIFLTNIRGLASLGHFNFGSQFVNVLRFAPNAVRLSWNPFYFNTVNENPKNAKKLIISRFEQLFFLLSIPCIIITVFSEEIILLFGNEKYYLSMFIIPVYAFTYFISITDFLSSNQITTSEKLMYQMPSVVIGGIANIVLNIILIQKFSALGAALAASLHFLISHIINMYFGNKLYPLPINIKKMILFFSILIMISCFSYILIGFKMDIIMKIFIKLLTIAIFILIVFRFSNLNIRSIIARVL